MKSVKKKNMNVFIVINSEFVLLPLSCLIELDPPENTLMLCLLRCGALFCEGLVMTLASVFVDL